MSWKVRAHTPDGQTSETAAIDREQAERVADYAVQMDGIVRAEAVSPDGEVTHEAAAAAVVG